ncbi:MAG TPA: zinc-binding dehydrogenase [Micromonosporaceae bacterium]|nr:zinc-binding dehydrogenase [Micromonosporaceae bacterium]
MRAVRLHGVADVRLSEEPEPTPEPGTELVRVTAVGLCGSDLHWYAEAGIGDARLDRPLVAGHEFAGVISGGPRDGQRVAVDPAIPDEVCESCREGWGNLCPNVRFAGHGAVDGGLREYLTWPSALLHTLPDGLSDADGAMLEPLGVAIHTLDLGHVHLGSTVAVVGCGPIGLLLVQAARLAGATTVIAVDPLPHRLEAALRFGADRAELPDPGTGVLADWSDLAGRGVDVGFEVAGNDAAVESTMAATRPGGRVVLAGIPDNDSTTFRASLARRKGLTIAMVRRMHAVYPRAISLVEKGLIDVTSIVTDRFPLAEAADAFKTASTRQGLKVIIEP